MKITHDLLKKMDACPEGIKLFDEKYPNGVEVIKGIREFLKLNRFNYCNWFLSHVLSRKNTIRYACYVAGQVLDIFEKQYPGDKRPRAAIEAAKRCIEDNSQPATAAAINAAAYAAAAHAAAYAAHAAAAINAAAYATANAANAAYVANVAAVDAVDAAYAADADKMKKKFIEYGITLLKKD